MVSRCQVVEVVSRGQHRILGAEDLVLLGGGDPSQEAGIASHWMVFRDYGGKSDWESYGFLDFPPVAPSSPWERTEKVEK